MSSEFFDNIRKDFQTFYQDVRKAIESSRDSNEEKLKILVINAITSYLAAHGLDISGIVEYEVGAIGTVKIKGRADALYGTQIIEFKTYDLLSSPKELEKSFSRVISKYLASLPEERRGFFYAVIFDGKNIVTVRYDVGKKSWIKERREFSETTLYDWLLLLIGALKKQVSVTRLRNDFALENETAQAFVKILYEKIRRATTDGHPRVNMLFNEWNKTFRFIYGGVLDESRLRIEFEELVKGILSVDGNLRVDHFLFVLYTYYAFIIKLFASEFASVSLGLAPQTPIRLLMASKDLRRDLSYIEDGKFFKDVAGIENYIEGGFFAWYLDVWDDKIEAIIKSVLGKINEYDTRSFMDHDSTARDLLKNLYQDIVPNRIRHDLGEYYTPDWLIQLTIEEIGYNGNPNQKVLDPGCGSGGFLVECINRSLKYNEGSGSKLSANSLLEKILQNIIGFDVNPVAVLTSRTNYLIAISSLLPFKEKTTITIPIFLADSIITPTTEGPGQKGKKAYNISTVEGIFSIPCEIVDKQKLEEILRSVELALENEYSINDFRGFIKAKHEIKESEILDGLVRFYEQLVKLHRSDKNKVWVNIIQNSFAPLLYSNFDFVVGNPPWIKWEFLAPNYRKKLGILYLDIYKLYSYRGMKAGMGYAHDDISIVFTYVAMDKYLRNGGKLGFLLKQTLYRGIAGKEFRKFMIEKNAVKVPVKVLKVHDLVELHPFEKSGSETSVIIIQKSFKNSYPIPYVRWHILTGHKPSEIQDSSDLEDALSITSREELDAYPDPSNKDPTDVWVTVPKGQKPSPVIITPNPYEVRHGVVNDLNSVFFLRVNRKQPNGNLLVSNWSDLGRKKVKSVTTEIEPDLVFPVVKPHHVKRWLINGYYLMIVPQKKHGEDNESLLRLRYPLTYAYLHSFKKELLGRSSRWFKGNKPFYSLFGIGPYTFKPYKVVWSAIGYLPAFAVASTITDEFLGKKLIIPDNTIGYIPSDSKEEAHFVCALLNSSLAANSFARTSTKSKWGISIGMVQRVQIPKFNPKNKLHTDLARMSMDAHKAAATGDYVLVREIEDKIEEVVMSDKFEEYMHNIIESV
jgi:hypothetical protein